MRVIAVDDEQIALDVLKLKLAELPDVYTEGYFTDAAAALQWLEKNEADVCFLDIQMRGVDGLTLAKRIREARPLCHVVFVTGYSEYAVDAFQLCASGYLLKPASTADIARVLESIMHPIAPPKPTKRLKVQCFGNFEAFIDGKPLQFKYNKSRELMAYLVHRRGAVCSVRELAAVLYEDEPNTTSLQSQLRNLVSDLTHTLRAAGAENVLLKARGSLAALTDAFSCDYYDFARGDAHAINAYCGEYMAQYSWAEFVIGYIEQNRT